MRGDRRRVTGLLGSTLAGAAVPGPLWAQPVSPRRGGTLVIAQSPEPTLLTTGLTTSPPTQQISSKIFDGLVALSPDNGPRPQLARAWTQSADGLTVTFHLRPHVRWHDGKPFTSTDVAFSVMEVWRKYSSRGRTAFPHVLRVDTPDPLTAVWVLAKPMPYLLAALNARDSQVLPAHLYAGRDVLSNPANTAPVGTGPFRFAKWERGSHIRLARNDDYWDRGKPYLDAVVYRFIADSAAAAAALETGSAHVAAGDNVALSDVDRLRSVPRLAVHRRVASYGGTGIMAFEFNLQRPVLRDLRVRQAFAHAIDRDFILRHIYRGQGTVADSPVPANFPQFYSSAVPQYPLDLKRAEALLDQAGLKRGADGVRLTLTLDPSPSPTYFQTAQFLRSSFAKIGVRLNVRTQDFAEWLARIYTRGDWDLNLSGASTAPDPAIGLQRFYWSRNIQPGVAYSNATHYRSDQTDRLLEAAQTEIDPKRRRQLYEQVQRQVLLDLPRIPVVSGETLIVAARQVQGIASAETGSFTGNLAETWLAEP